MIKHHWTVPQKPDRVVVLGRRGFVASASITALLDSDIAIEAIASRDLDLTSSGAGDKLCDYLRDSDVLLFVSAIAPCKDTPALMSNLKMAEAVYFALQKQPVAQVVYVSSDAVYPSGSNPIDESTLTAPEGMHGLMHLTREVMIKEAVDSPVCILRPSLLYGADDPHNGYGPNRFRRLASEGKNIQLFGEGEEKRDHVLIDDLATLVTLCVMHRSDGILNIVSGDSSSFKEVAVKVVSHFENSVSIEGTPRQNDITHVHYDNITVSKAFPKFCFTSLEDGLKKVHSETLTRK